MREVVGFSMAQGLRRTRSTPRPAWAPGDVDVVELHDCFAHNELLSYEALGPVRAGGAQKFVDDGDNTYGGKVVTNPSGGLLSKGHPLGATGLAQCTELVQQLRGTADQRQVEGARWRCSTTWAWVAPAW
jgi:acetyl-CoA acetyltransferase